MWIVDCFVSGVDLMTDVRSQVLSWIEYCRFLGTKAGYVERDERCAATNDRIKCRQSIPLV